MESKIGNKVKKLRLSLGMSQEEFGKKLGYTSRSSINKIEKGINDISYDKLILLIKEYNIDLKSIVDDKIQTSLMLMTKTAIFIFPLVEELKEIVLILLTI